MSRARRSGSAARAAKRTHLARRKALPEAVRQLEVRPSAPDTTAAPPAESRKRKTPVKRTGKSAAGSPAAVSREKPKIPPPREPHIRDRAKPGNGAAGRGEVAGLGRTAVAIFDTSVPVYMQTVRETSICPELSPLRSLIAAADVAAADLAAYAFRTGTVEPSGPPPGLDPAFLSSSEPPLTAPHDGPPEPAGEEERWS
ncbi:MAG: hypothetical protein HOU81_27085 [Hamadaea sp.]|uniref:hypothetical protein n=1 Tax=Hamadaea sp. TaxID=2024425 RepID=UPI0017B0822D|nr:hypothetical protein [Hamadaea sp.]NUR74490.1 hypothetical protein [Hamadaea sp.]NUT21419.1 hypothetical protein [Hamadaea sp.]